MIAADSSSLSAYFKGERGTDVDLVRVAMTGGQLVLPPATVTELLSTPNIVPIERLILDLEMLELTGGYWARAGRMRRLLLSRGLKAKVADALIAQSCVDHDVPLITRDPDFRHFAKHCGLKLA
jgi:predicted nucleic acid-binding protein